MAAKTLYKYLDVKGGLAMLEHHNIQFTNATKFNDPFDCHPALFDYSNVPATQNNWPPADFISSMEENQIENIRNDTWISCLSKVHDSLLMWAYYNNHKGVCIGLNKDILLRCCQDKFIGFMYPSVKEVKYKELLPKIDYFRDRLSNVDIFAIKAKVWEHEQEVRIVTQQPAWVYERRDIPDEFKGDKEVDGREVRHYPLLSRDCFESVYLGVNILPRNKDKIISAAKKLNSEIKIYQMTIDSEAFRLKEELIES